MNSAAVVRLCNEFWLVAIIDRWFMRQVKRHTYTQAWLVERHLVFFDVIIMQNGTLNVGEIFPSLFHSDLHTITRVVSQ